ncbi:MAG: multicomponent Na+:H+ antiporter subunit D [Rickettsiales bacterium]|jgi:multicomponent Na+:H+ antiporter subunit D
MSPYLLLFLPLISSLVCLLINFKKADFWIFTVTCFGLLCLTFKISFDLFKEQTPIQSDVGMGILSVPTEYYFDSLSLFFLASILLSRLVISFFCDSNIRKDPKRHNCRQFYCVSLFNLFALVGILSTNNIFNLFIYIEIFCLTFASTMAISGDFEICKSSFRYFCKSAISSILLLLSFVLLYISSGSFKINEISNLSAIGNTALIFSMIMIAVLLKFFSFGIYFIFLKSKDPMANFLTYFSFSIGGLIGSYLLISFFTILLGINSSFYYVCIVIGFCLVIYASYKMLRDDNLKSAMIHISLMSLGLAAAGHGFFKEEAFHAVMVYVINSLLMGFLLLIFMLPVVKKISNSHFPNFSELNADKLSKENWIYKLFSWFVIIILSNYPVYFMFWASWELVIMAFNTDISLFIIALIMLSKIVMAVLLVNILRGNNPKMKLFSNY